MKLIPMILIEILRETTMAPSLAQLSRLPPKTALTAAAMVLVGAGFYSSSSKECGRGRSSSTSVHRTFLCAQIDTKLRIDSAQGTVVIARHKCRSSRQILQTTLVARGAGLYYLGTASQNEGLVC
jgi:hypothetical protein